MNRSIRRLALLAPMLFVATACAQATAGGSFQRDVALSSSGSGTDCRLRVENGYDVAIQAGARAGAEEVQLGSIDAHDALEITVPCAYQAVTVYRVLETASTDHTVALGSRARALDPQRITTVTLRPGSARSVRPGR